MFDTVSFVTQLNPVRFFYCSNFSGTSWFLDRSCNIVMNLQSLKNWKLVLYCGALSRSFPFVKVFRLVYLVTLISNVPVSYFYQLLFSLKRVGAKYLYFTIKWKQMNCENLFVCKSAEQKGIIVRLIYFVPSEGWGFRVPE